MGSLKVRLLQGQSQQIRERRAALRRPTETSPQTSGKPPTLGTIRGTWGFWRGTLFLFQTSPKAPHQLISDQKSESTCTQLCISPAPFEGSKATSGILHPCLQGGKKNANKEGKWNLCHWLLLISWRGYDGKGLLGLNCRRNGTVR